MPIRFPSMAALVLGTAIASACSSSGKLNGPTPLLSTTARYRVIFQSTWTAVTHPVDFPATAHFSRLIGGTHNGSVVFWRDGDLASEGVKDMAERGRTTPLDMEVAAAVAAGTAQHVLIGEAIDVSPGSVSLDFDISQAFPFVTLVSMVAPSPDWFVGVSRLPLFENGQWVDERTINLDAWDAGTDSGATFSSPDLVTAPRLPISRILSSPLSPGGQVTALGKFTFTRRP